MSDNQYRLPILKPEGNVPESQRIGGDEQSVPVLATRLTEAIGFFERNISDRAGLGAEELALPVPVRHRLLRHGVHVASRRAATTSRASAPSSRASRRARPTC